MTKHFSFSKKDRLKSKADIERLFKEGRSITAYPLKLIYVHLDDLNNDRFQCGVSVSKRIHKKAATRNHIKRLLRESYRLLKPDYFNKTETGLAFMILYLSKDEPTFEELNLKMKVLLSKLKASKQQFNET